MDERDVVVKVNGVSVKAKLSYDAESFCIDFDLNGSIYSCCGKSLFSSFIGLRSMLPNVEFLCKGAKVNVYPSRASSQMSAGLMAYELTLGKQALRENLVNIFDYESEEVTNDPLIQHDFFECWIKSLR